jgi:hydroxypyruvate reductase 1
VRFEGPRFRPSKAYWKTAGNAEFTIEARSRGGSTLTANEWKVFNPSGTRRVVVTKELPGRRWLNVLAKAGARVEYGTGTRILSTEEIAAVIGDRCDGAIGQLTESWHDQLFSALRRAGGKVYANYAVGYDNVDVDAATKRGIPVGNTPGVLTEATAEMAVALTLAAARRIPQADNYMRGGSYEGWLPKLFLGELLARKTVGVIGAGRIGAAYARTMVQGFMMNLVYFDVDHKRDLEDFVRDYAGSLAARGETPVTVTRAANVEEVLEKADVVSLHPPLNEATHHLLNGPRLRLMKTNAILVNTARGPVIEEPALVAHCRKNPDFKVGLDVFEVEPRMAPGLSSLENVVITPHIASATRWTREAMATLAASNVAGILMDWPVSTDPSRISEFLEDPAPEAAPSIVNAGELGLPTLEDNVGTLER